MGEGGPKPAGSLCDGLGLGQFFTLNCNRKFKGLVQLGGDQTKDRSFTFANRYVFPTLWPPQSKKCFKLRVVQDVLGLQ